MNDITNTPVNGEQILTDERIAEIADATGMMAKNDVLSRLDGGLFCIDFARAIEAEQALKIADLKRTVEWLQGRTGILMGAKENAVQQAQQWAQEARTQRATVISILNRFGLPENDWEAKRLIVKHVEKLIGTTIPPGPVVADQATEVIAAAQGAPTPTRANAGPSSGDMPMDRFIAALPLPQYPVAAPAPTEQAAKAIYRLFDGADEHPWVEGGNSTKQDDARRYARAALAARQAPAGAVNGDAIAKSKRILNLVDEYELRPTSGNRTTLRMALMAEFEAVGQAPDSRDSTQATTTVPSAK